MRPHLTSLIVTPEMEENEVHEIIDLTGDDSIDEEEGALEGNGDATLAEVHEIIDLTGDDFGDEQGGAMANDGEVLPAEEGEEAPLAEMEGDEQVPPAEVQVFPMTGDEMRLHRTGLFGSPTCKLEIQVSTIPNAGRGVFIRPGVMVRRGEIVTLYSGRKVSNNATFNLTPEERLYTLSLDGLNVVGKRELSNGDGFGSLINGRSPQHGAHTNVSVVKDRSTIYVRMKLKTEFQTGPFELFMGYGRSYWAHFNNMNAHK